MKITICGSMCFSKEMSLMKEELAGLNYDVVLPKFTEEYCHLESKEEMHTESAENKIKHDLIRGYFHEIRQSDAILVLNFNKNGIDHYIGANTLIEMAFAHVLNKKIFLLNPIPDMSCKDEIIAMQPTIINGDLMALKS